MIQLNLLHVENGVYTLQIDFINTFLVADCNAIIDDNGESEQILN